MYTGVERSYICISLYSLHREREWDVPCCAPGRKALHTHTVPTDTHSMSLPLRCSGSLISAHTVLKAAATVNVGKARCFYWSVSGVVQKVMLCVAMPFQVLQLKTSGLFYFVLFVCFCILSVLTVLSSLWNSPVPRMGCMGGIKENNTCQVIPWAPRSLAKLPSFLRLSESSDICFMCVVQGFQG